MINTYHLSKQNSQDYHYPRWKTLKSRSCNVNEINGGIKRTKIKQTKTGECPEKKSKKAIKEKKTQFYRNVLSSKGSKEIWKVINRILNPNMSTLQADPYALNEFFNKMAERLVEKNATSHDVVLSDIDLLTSSHGSYKIQKSNIQWRTQVSQITTKILFNWTWKHPSFFYQTNSRIHCLTFPDKWKIVSISLIPKVINPTELKDYHSISILSILSKVFEKQVLHQIRDFIETQQSYNKHQSQKPLSCNYALKII